MCLPSKVQGKVQHLKIFKISYQIKNTKSISKLIWIGDSMMRKLLNIKDCRTKDVITTVVETCIKWGDVWIQMKGKMLGPFLMKY